jgi:Uncharacterized protein conserved in bacteria
VAVIKKNDFLLIGAVLLICLIAVCIMNVTKKEGSKLVITVDGKIYDTLDLNKNTTYTVKGTDGAYNTFEVKDGTVQMLEASCPDKLCVHQKKIRYHHQTIVCLPNKVVLQVISDKKSNVDMIAN